MSNATALPALPSMPMPPYPTTWQLSVFPFVFQSGMIPSVAWITIFTLSLAPLIAHVAAGTSPPKILSPTSLPRWHDKLALYNPVSILWRYGAMLDRRVRAGRHWTDADLAACNAIFWTDRGWDGTDLMAEESRRFCVRLPEPGLRRFMSWTTVKTIIVTLQGFQAIYHLIWALEGREMLCIGALGVDTMWLTISEMGSLRVVALLWLTDDFDYRFDVDTCSRSGSRRKTVALSTTRTLTAPETPPGSTTSHVRGYIESESATLAEPVSIAAFYPPVQLAPTSSWQSWAARTFYLLLVYTLTVEKYLWVMPYSSDITIIQNATFSVSAICLWCFYAVLQTLCSILFTYYFVVGYQGSTIIPCAGTVWYKVFTCLLFLYAVICLVLVCLETRSMPCGMTTTFPPESGIDALLCPYVVVKGF